MYYLNIDMYTCYNRNINSNLVCYSHPTVAQKNKTNFFFFFVNLYDSHRKCKSFFIYVFSLTLALYYGDWLREVLARGSPNVEGSLVFIAFLYMIWMLMVNEYPNLGSMGFSVLCLIWIPMYNEY